LEAADKQSLACLVNYSSMLDDGAPDVASVARAASNICRREREEFYRTVARGRGALDHNIIKLAVEETDLEAASFLVLNQRANKWREQSKTSEQGRELYMEKLPNGQVKV